MKTKMIEYYMDIAKRTAELSYCKRLQVGAIIVKDDRIISIGYNGTPPGSENICEEDFVTKPEVLHAEENAIGKLAKGHESGKDATMFITHAPCLNCAKTILVSGISTIYYNEIYRCNDGINFLDKCGLAVIHYK